MKKIWVICHKDMSLTSRNNKDISVNEYDLQLVDLNIATIVGFLCCSTVELV